MLARTAWWSSLAVLAYAFIVYPLVVLARARLRPKAYLRSEITPPVTVVIAAHNEAPVIGRKLEALLASDYPPDCLSVIVSSDGSDDATVQVAARFTDRGVTVLDLPRRGKAATLNAAIEHAAGEILVFTDANSELAPDALRHLVSPLADAAVGGVAGNQVYRPTKVGEGTGEMAYWDVDRRLKSAASVAGSAVSATGALYAIRRELVGPIPEGVTDDFITSTGVIAQGRRLVFAPEAIAYEAVASSSEDEFARKVRVMTRGFRGVLLRRELLDPRRHGFYAVQLFTEKVLKRLTAIPLLVMLLAGASAWRGGAIYRVATMAEAAVVLAGAAGLRFQRTQTGRSALLSVPAYFCMVSAASLVALRNALTGRRLVQWRPVRDIVDDD